MAAITLRVGAAANLTAAQVDANFTNVNNELVADTAAIAVNTAAIALKADAAATTAAIAAAGSQNAVTITGNTTLTQALHGSRTVEVTASCTLTLNLDATDGWVPPSTTASGSSLYIQCAAGVVITWAGTATITPTVGASNAADSTVARLIGLDHSLTANTWIVTSVQVGVADLNGTDITATRAIAAGDFGTGIIRLNAAGVIALTLPTVASMTLAATPGKVRTLVFHVTGAGIPTFAGATASTILNGVAGPAAVTPIGGAPVQYGYVTLTQTAAGADTWSLVANGAGGGGGGLPVNNPVFTGVISGPNGTAAAPSYAVGPTANQTGFYQSAAFAVGITQAAGLAWEFGSTGILRSFTVGKGVTLTEGANGLCGEATLVAGTVTVSNNLITATSRIMLTVKTVGGTQGLLRTSRVAATSFTITSANAADTSTVEYVITQGV